MRVPSLLAACAVVVVAVSMAVSAAPIRPDALGGLELWLKADELHLADGTAVTTWADSSGQGHDAVTVAAAPPTFTTGPLTAVRFSSSFTEILEAADLRGGATVADGTIVALYSTDTNSESTRPVGFGSYTLNGTEGGNAHWNLAPDPSLRFDGSNIGAASYTLAHPTNQYLTRTCTKGGQTLAEWFDGAAALPSKTHSSTLKVVDDFHIGDLRANVGNTDVAEVIVYDRVLTDAERQGVEAYLTAKYRANAHWRFENGTAGSQDPGSAGNVLDYTVNTNDGTAKNSSGSNKPAYSSDVPAATVPLTGSSNTLSLDFERSSNHYVEVPHDPGISFGNNPYTLEGYVKLESLGTTASSSRQYVMLKKQIGSGFGDNFADYIFVANAGNMESAARPNSLALHLGVGDAATSSIQQQVILSDLRITDHDWHYLSASFDPTAPEARRVRFVLDDQVDYQATTFVPGESSGPLMLGSHFNNTGTHDIKFDGKMDELRISGGRLATPDLLDPQAANSPVAGYWRFDNGVAGAQAPAATGSIADYSGKGNHGTAMNASGSTKPVYRSDVAQPLVGGAYNDLSLDFNSSQNHYVAVPNAPSLDFDGDTDTYTIEGWVKLEPGASGRQYLVQKKVIGDGDGDQQYALLANIGDLATAGVQFTQPGFTPTSRQVGMAFANGSQQYTAVSTQSITDNEWHYVAATLNANNDTVRFVVDDQMEVLHGVSLSHYVPTDAPLIFGGHFNSSSVFSPRTNGRLDEIRISAGEPRPDGLLSDAAAQAASTVGWYRFENGSLGQPAPGTPQHVVDFSGFANHGTAANGPTYAPPCGTVIPVDGTPNTLSLGIARASGQYVEVPHDPSISFGNNPFTLEAFVKLATPSTNSVAGRQYVMLKKAIGEADTKADYGLLATAGDIGGASRYANLCLALGKGTGGTAWSPILSDLAITDTDWHSISAAFDPDTNLVRFVLDGVVDYQSTAFVPGENTGSLVLGGHFDASGTLAPGFNGWLDEVRISSRYLEYGELLGIPEPTSMALLGLGLAALARRRRPR